MGDLKKLIEEGRAILGIEFGSTRIKAVLIDDKFNPIAQGSHEWENRYENGLWTYSLDDIWTGLQSCYADLGEDVMKRYGAQLTSLAGIGISAMMHGYMPFDSAGNLLVPFRTWRNTNTGKAAKELSDLFNFNVPLRWSVSHLYQAIIDNEPHIKEISFVTTLAGYVHWMLTGEKVIGIDDGSGMFPLGSDGCSYDAVMAEKFDRLAVERLPGINITSLLPALVKAGEQAGRLTAEGAALLDPSGRLKAGIPMCAPEGDAGTGMVATNAVKPGTGNVSAGTSSFSMIVLDRELSKPYEAIDIVATPDGSPVAMVHCNNCTSDINAWVAMFGEFAKLSGNNLSTSDLYEKLFNCALDGDPDCGGLVSYNFLSGEPLVGLEEGRPMVVRSVGDKFNLSNFMRTLLYSAVACLKIGNDILFNEENIKIERLMAHGGFFKTKEVGQRVLATALNSVVSVMETAGEGGAWGMALLAAYMAWNKEGLSLTDFLEEKVFVESKQTTVSPRKDEVDAFDRFMEGYKAYLPAEKEAVKERGYVV